MTEASCSSLNDIVPETICDSAGAGILSNASAAGKLPVTIFGAVSVSIIKLLVVETLWSVDGAARGLSGDQYPTGSFLRKRPDAKGPMVRASSSTHYIPHWVQTKDGPR